MNEDEWARRFVHPYAGLKKAEETHGHLKPTLVRGPSYSTFASPWGGPALEALGMRLGTTLALELRSSGI
ncbi:hypothetical protein, partial [Burkholderia pseudomallei]|uniref:hypothetical protein n=1 Tax=Burkholderia pseudomallei TaxID=28450 RepID=UPI001AD6B8AD|nr:hypothetical protein [Burkholderia pseudomallei]